MKNYRIPTSLSEKLSTGLQGLSGDIPPAMQLSVSTIPGGAKGTKATLEQMKKITVGAVTDREHGAFLRGLAIKITREAGCDSKEHFCEAKALANWVRDEIRWIRAAESRVVLAKEIMNTTTNAEPYFNGNPKEEKRLAEPIIKASNLAARPFAEDQEP